MGKRSWQIFPGFINELCRRPRGTKGQKILAVNWTLGCKRKEMRRGAVIKKVSGYIDIADNSQSILCTVWVIFCAIYSIIGEQEGSDLLRPAVVGLCGMTQGSLRDSDGKII